MRSTESLRKIFALSLLTVIILSACATTQASPSVRGDANIGDPPDISGSDATDVASDQTALVEGENSANLEAEASTPDAEQVDATLILMADNVTTLDPYQMVSIHPDESVASHIWDTLTFLNDDLQLEPHLAESWRLVNNFTWEFKLRPGLAFHNGEPIDAQAVRFSIERAQSMPTSLETFASDVDLANVVVVDDYTLQLTSKRTVVNLPYHLAFLEILPPVYYAETSPDQLAVAPVGSGPYELAEDWTPGQPVVLEAVSTYWMGTPVLPRLVFETIPQPEERLAALRLDKAALVTDLPPLPADQWNEPASRVEAIESTQRMFIGIRAEAASPLASGAVRQALNYGVNVEQIADDWLEGYGERYGSWVNPPGNNPDLAPWPYDPELARELLTEAGYTQGFTVTMSTPAGTYYRDVEISEAIAEQLAEIGVTVKVKPVNNWGIYARTVLTGKTAPLFLLELNSRGDALEDAKNLSTAFAFNPTNWHNETFEQVLGQAANTFNDNARIRLLNNAQSIAYHEAPWIWLWRSYHFYGISQDLDWTPRRDGLVNLYKPQ